MIQRRFGQRLAAVALVLMSFGIGRAFAQATATGTIQGTVFDQSQAVVGGADVTVTSKATGERRSAMSSEVGTYRFDFLTAGAYTVKVTRSGFAAVVQGVDLLVGQTAIANVTLTPGATTEVVEVTGAAPLVDLGKSGVSQNITPTEVQELPMVGRDVANLAYLVPGVKAADSYDPTKNRYAILSVNGAGGRNVNVTVNGIDNKDNTVGGPVMQLPLEAVQEFQISTQRFSAENGRSEGAAINMITKQGTNNYHGSAFGYFRNTNMNTDEKVPDGTGGFTPAHPDYSRQQFGGSASGPFKKDKVFAFFAIERERESSNLEESGTSYSELALAAGAGLAAQPATSIPRPFYETRYNGRLDWTINGKNRMYASYSSQANDSLNDQSDGTGDLTNGNFTNNHMIVANVTLNSVITNTTVNTVTAGYQYWNNLIASNIAAPLVVFPDASFGTNTNVPQQSFQKKWQFKDDLSRSIGKHTLKMGVDFIYTPIQGGFFEYTSTPEIDFADDPSVILNSPTLYPQKFATPGAVVGLSATSGNPYFLVPAKQFGLYFQDDWKVSPRLTVSLGIRYDRDFNTLGESDVPKSRTYQELVALNSPISNPYVSKLPHDDTKDFSPRLGFAYDFTGKGTHVMRGGYGLYYGDVFQNIPLFMEQMSNATVFQSVFTLSSPSDIVPGTGIALGNWRYGVDKMPTIPAPSSQLNSGSTGRLMDPNYRNPVSEEFNIGYTWAVSPNSVIEAEYTHVLSLHENKTVNIDQKIPMNGACCTRPLDAAFAASGQPLLGSVRDEQSVGRSHYDGVNFSFRRRMSQHFSVDANYTLAWSYAYSAGGSSFRNYPMLSTNFLAAWDWGPSPNDERHHVTVSGIIDLGKGFQLAPIMQYGSARAYGLVNSSNTLNTGGGTYNYPVVVPTSAPTNYFAFAGNNTGAQNCFYGLNGVSQGCTLVTYDALRGDPFFQLDMSLAKNFRFGERMKLKLVAQAFNLTNRANYGNDYNNNIASKTTFGHPAGFINPSSTTTPRSVWGELGVRLDF